jgi:hypothetical protein
MHPYRLRSWLRESKAAARRIDAVSLCVLATTVNVTAISLGVSNADGVLWFVEAAIMRMLTRPPNRRAGEIQVPGAIKAGLDPYGARKRRVRAVSWIFFPGVNGTRAPATHV